MGQVLYVEKCLECQNHFIITVLVSQLIMNYGQYLYWLTMILTFVFNCLVNYIFKLKQTSTVKARTYQNLLNFLHSVTFRPGIVTHFSSYCSLVVTSIWNVGFFSLFLVLFWPTTRCLQKHS